MNKLLILTILLICETGLGAERAELPDKELVCRACHGEAGNDTLLPAYPKIAGQNEAYLIATLKLYRSGQRTGGLAQLMVAQTEGLSDAEIAELAKYYANMPLGSE